MTTYGEAVLFWILAPLSILGALGLLLARKSVHAALGMALVMVNLGVFYIANQAQFLGVIQIFVYSGAVMMLFLFVVMLVGVDSSDSRVETITGQRWLAAIFTLALLLLLVRPFAGITFTAAGLDATNASTGNVNGLAELIFGRYVWVFEVTSLLLITAALGAMVLAHRVRLSSPPNQREWSIARFQRGHHPAGLPAPGVYARSNAVDTPALLPDGTPSELSMSRVLSARQQVNPAAPYVEAEHAIEREIEEGGQR